MGDQGVQQMQQPVVMYPNADPKQYPNPSSSSSSSSSSSGSSGNFGTVFIVLAVILVLTVLSCVFGRLCNRASQQHSKQPKHEKGLSSKKSREIRPVDREPKERGDMEFGLDMKRPEVTDRERPSGREDIELGFDKKREERKGASSSPPPRPVIKHGVRFKLPETGRDQGEIRRL